MSKRGWWLVLLVVLLSACASVPRTVELSREQLQAALDRKFPFERRFLEVVELKATGPVIALLPSSNRIGIEVSLTATDRMARVPLQGLAAMSFVPRYEPSDHSIRMTQVRVDMMDLPNAAPAWRTQLERVARMFGEAALEGAVLHTFRPEEVARAQGWAPGELRVTATGVRITLQPPK
jgi:hypothetical protein